MKRMSPEDREDLITRVMMPAMPHLSREQIEFSIDLLESLEGPEDVEKLSRFIKHGEVLS